MSGYEFIVICPECGEAVWQPSDYQQDAHWKCECNDKFFKVNSTPTIQAIYITEEYD